MSDVARRKGYSPAAMDGNVEMQSIEGRANPPYRFLNKNTTSQPARLEWVVPSLER
jgi:hypothetical protein